MLEHGGIEMIRIGRSIVFDDGMSHWFRRPKDGNWHLHRRKGSETERQLHELCEDDASLCSTLPCYDEGLRERGGKASGS